MATMKAARVHEWGGSENVFVDDVPIPEPNSGEVIIRVHASSINPVDWKAQLGYMKQWLQLPFTLGWDAAGEIAAVGEGVTNFKVGDAVYGKPNGGGFVQYLAIPAANVAPRSQQVSAAEAATFPTAALTAYQAIFDKADLQAGQTILIHGAAGGCGHFAVQLARWKGAHVIGTGSAENEDFVRGLGAEGYVNYRTTRFEDVVHDADVVFDTVGGETFTRSFAAAKPGGIVVTIAARPEQPEINGVRATGLGATGTTAQLAEMTRLIDAGHVKPTISATYPLDQVRVALDRNHEGHTRGKISLEIP
ncbi:MAG TPA: NADP-dependent oxidoreductase [Phototrophicaceae bacterium]|nr:NADP-dependent oxidoreductase [Phototrophicaceae bacterium]